MQHVMGGEDASMGTVEGVDRHHLSVPGVIVSGGVIRELVGRPALLLLQ